MVITAVSQPALGRVTTDHCPSEGMKHVRGLREEIALATTWYPDYKSAPGGFVTEKQHATMADVKDVPVVGANVWRQPWKRGGHGNKPVRPSTRS